MSHDFVTVWVKWVLQGTGGHKCYRGTLQLIPPFQPFLVAVFGRVILLRIVTAIAQYYYSFVGGRG